MTNKLDFIVFGMPRGGTSATARYLSATQHIHCGVEVFPPNIDHSEISVPDAFIAFEHDRWRSTSKDEVLSRGDEIRFFGNKTPNYYNRLNGILAELDNCPAISCVRDPFAVARSYNARAANRKDPWQKGRRGVFAIMDTISLLRALVHAPDDANILIAPHQCLLDDWRSAVKRMAEHVAPAVPTAFEKSRVMRINQIKRKQGRKVKTELQDFEAELVGDLVDSGFSALFDSKTHLLLSDVKGQIEDILSQFEERGLAGVDEAVSLYGEDDVVNYYKRWHNITQRLDD
ncbi:sulfotransferase [Parasphingopyxis sp.]|uniref:sulfotransferase n=1 Tax=Parasphingopyxis sp. TaxID=1920299 RepID=UPI00345981A2